MNMKRTVYLAVLIIAVAGCFGHPAWEEEKSEESISSNCFQSCLCHYKSDEFLANCGDNGNNFTSIITVSDVACNMDDTVTSVTLKEINFDVLSIVDDSCVRNRVTKLTIQHSTVSLIFFASVARLFPKLEYVAISFNTLNSTFAVVRDEIAMLIVLHLGKNGIVDFVVAKSGADFQLERLDLSYNSISYLDSETFMQFVALKYLNLAGNRLTYLHPSLFNGLHQLTRLHLEDNLLEFLSPDVFENVPSLQRVSLHGNRWRCSCSLSTLQPYRHLMLGESRSRARRENSDIPMCYDESVSDVGVPMAVYLDSANESLCNDVELTEPLGANVVVRLTHSLQLQCNSPSPVSSVYWVTPHGILVNKRQAHYQPMQANDSVLLSSMSVISHPTYTVSSIEVLANGSLSIINMRHYFSGEYTCVVSNPVSNASYTTFIDVQSMINTHYLYSCIVGALCAIVLLIAGVLACTIDNCCEKRRRKRHHEHEGVDDEVSDDDDDSYIANNHSWWVSRNESPMKCVTPAEGLIGDVEPIGYATNIWETLEAAGLRLREGVHRLRGRAAHMRESSSHYMQNLRESSNQHMQHLRRTSRKHMRQVKSSMVVSMEQVKNHVRSMKELCGTGDLTQTISVASVLNDNHRPVRLPPSSTSPPSHSILPSSSNDVSSNDANNDEVTRV